MLLQQPPSSLLNSFAIRSFATTLSNNTQQPDSAQPPISSVGSKVKSLFSNMESRESSKASDVIIVAPGIPPLKRSLVDQILAGKFIDLGDLPPAKSFSKPLSALASGLDGNVVLLHATELAQSKKLIPDLASWAQCFAIYAAVFLTAHPQGAPSMMMYMTTIAKLSKKFQWPSWIRYDHDFRQEAEATGKQD